MFSVCSSEEIPLEDFQHSRNNSPRARSNNSNASSRSHTPSRLYLNYDQISVHNASPRDPTLLGQLNGIALAKEVVVPPLPLLNSSEETSFIANDIGSTLSSASSNGSASDRRKGVIETV